MTLAAFFLAVGIGAHTLDELNGRPLGTQLSDRTLIALAVCSLAGAIGIGIAGCFIVSATLVPFVVAGGFIVIAYNLELFGGRFHTDFWLAAAWGAFPALTSWWVNTLSFGSAKTVVAGALVAVGCFGLASVQRRLSTPVRRLRRKTISVSGEQRLEDGTVIALTAIGARRAARCLPARAVLGGGRSGDRPRRDPLLTQPREASRAAVRD